MHYSFDDQYNIVTKKFSHLSSSNDHLITEFAIDYFQYKFDETEIQNCWKIVHNANSNSQSSIPLTTNIDRLENISWRKWAKMKYELKEIAPEMVNWYKDCDITWLYGPLAGSSSNLYQQASNVDGTELIPSRTSSFSSMTSASTADSLDEEHECCLDDRNEDIFVDEHYLDNIDQNLTFHVKPILKNRRVSSLGYLEFEVPSSIIRTSGNVKKDNKSVSFDTIVQIRQFHIDDREAFYN